MHVSQINNEDYSERKKKKPSRIIIPLIWNNFFFQELKNPNIRKLIKFEKMEILWETCYKTERENIFTKIKINNFQENP